jgi:hypothetical protein
MEIEKAYNNLTPQQLAEVKLPERYKQPGFFTDAGQLDRREEGAHVVSMRGKQRRLIEAVADQQMLAIVAEAAEQRKEDEFNSWLFHRLQALDDAKSALRAAEISSNRKAGDNPVLRSEFAVLDAEFFQETDERLGAWRRPGRA